MKSIITFTVPSILIAASSIYASVPSSSGGRAVVSLLQPRYTARPSTFAAFQRRPPTIAPVPAKKTKRTIDIIAAFSSNHASYLIRHYLETIVATSSTHTSDCSITLRWSGYRQLGPASPPCPSCDAMPKHTMRQHLPVACKI